MVVPNILAILAPATSVVSGLSNNHVGAPPVVHQRAPLRSQRAVAVAIAPVVFGRTYAGLAGAGRCVPQHAIAENYSWIVNIAHPSSSNGLRLSWILLCADTRAGCGC